MKYGLSGKKMHEGLTEDELVDVGEKSQNFDFVAREFKRKKKYGLSYYY